MAVPNPQTQGSTTWEPESNDPKARVRAHQARMPVLDKGARVHPDPRPSADIVTVNPNTYFGSATQLEGEQNIFLPCAGSELHAAPSAPQTSFHSFYHHLTPSRARIRRVGKLLPPSGPPPNTVALNPRTRKLKTWKNQGEHQHWTAHLSSMAAPEI